MGDPFIAKLFIHDFLALFIVRHELLLYGRGECEAICFLPLPPSSFTESSDYAVTINMRIRLEILKLVMYVDLFAVYCYLFHVILRLVV